MKEKQTSKLKNNKHILNKIYTEDYLKKLAKEIEADFEKRKQERRSFELTWQLAINFLMGNQYCEISHYSEIEDRGKQYFWQEREVFNHIAPIVETRIARLSSIRPTLTVVPATTDEQDIYSAKLGKSILKAVSYKLDLNQIINEVTKWSEICGTAFYKVIWNNSGGKTLAINEKNERIAEGDVEILALPPYEIYPSSCSAESVDACESIIHARTYSINEIKSLWGEDVAGGNIDVFTLENSSIIGGLGYSATVPKVSRNVKENYAVVIEKYEAPSLEFPNGRLIIVSGGKVLHIDELPFVNKPDGKRGFPFVRQVAHSQPGSFWGVSVIDRCIPIQRSYNAVKNRKHEFMNRISMGILTVEDGSIDTENLEEEGLSPGKILVYRQGSNPPGLMQAGNIPSDFTTEETLLLNEFNNISGVSELMRNASKYVNNGLSGTALQLLIDQDDSRLKETSDQIKISIKEIGKHIIRLYKQFALLPRLAKLIGSNGDLESFYFSASDMSSDDVVFETEAEAGETLSQKRNWIMELINSGLLEDENGKISNSTRSRVLEMLGFGIWDNSQDLNAINIKRADEENIKAKKGVFPEILEIDNHELHIERHSAYVLNLSGGNKKIKDILINHIKEHKELKSIENAKQNFNLKGIN